MKLPAEREFAAFIGIDWADAKHDLCLQTADSEERELVVLPHRADAIEAWAVRCSGASRADPWRCAWKLPRDRWSTGTLLFCDFLGRWPTLKQLQRARKATLQTFFYEHHVRSQACIEQRWQAIKKATPLTDDRAVIGPNQLLVHALVDQMRVTLQAIERFDAEIATVSQTMPDYALFRALPAAGVTLAPRLLAAFGEQRERYASAADIQKYAGIAPVTESSGKKHWVHWRLQCPTFLRQTFVEWAGATVPRSFWAAAYYRQQRAKGCSHQAAVRALAFKWTSHPLSLLADAHTLR